MYKLHLILKYLRRRRIAWVALIAVMLCTAMVLVVISVMGGWLRMFRASFQGLSGDIVIRGESRTGFPFYEEMIAELEKLPEVEAAAPLIETYGLVNIDNRIRQAVRVIGLPMDRIGRVNGFWDSLYLQNPKTSPDGPLADEAMQQMRAEIESQKQTHEEGLRAELAAGRITPEAAEAERARVASWEQSLMAPYEAWAARRKAEPAPSFELPWPAEVYRAKLDRGNRPSEAADPASYPGMIVGTGLAGIDKQEDGSMDRWLGLEPTNPRPVKFMTLAISDDFSTIDLSTARRERTFWIVDNSRTGVFQTDDQSVYVDFALLQLELGMDRQNVYAMDPETFEPTEEVISEKPARAGEIHVNLAEGVELTAGEAIVQQVVDRVLKENEADPLIGVRVETWEAKFSDFLTAVEREKLLVTTLFAFISIVAIFLIFCIFYMIVAEKIKDIGIIKSVGATAGGIAGIFLGYGAAIGIVGGALGVLVGGLIVHYINEIHDLMGHVLGIQIWSAQTYMFDEIPNTMNPREVAVIVAVAILSSILGAVVPALRAASLKPVEALRFE